MKVGIIDADLLDRGTKFPNLALMKISTYNKKEGNDVDLLLNWDSVYDYDKLYISKVFSSTNIPLDISTLNCEYGGTGFFYDKAPSLPQHIEHIRPDYSLYNSYLEKVSLNKKDYTDYSIGFTTRGCFRQCSFCVNKNYKKVAAHSPLEEFVDESRNKIYLLDDNIFAFPKWDRVWDELIGLNKPFQYKQGMDIRLLSKKKCEYIKKAKYSGDVIFAFDHIEDRTKIEEKLRLYRSTCDKSTKLYVLCAYDSQDHVDIINTFERIRILMRYRCLPYIMRYNSFENSPYRGMYINLAAWCNQPSFFKKMTFREFCEQRGNGTGAATRYMLDFEKQHPEVAKQYYDMRF